jgi:hypothetical protein
MDARTPNGEHEMDTSTETLHCADCGRSGDANTIVRHSGAVSQQGNDGRIRRTSVALCPDCAAKRLEVQESALI